MKSIVINSREDWEKVRASRDDFITLPKQFINETLEHINNMATLAKMHQEADNVPGYDIPLTSAEYTALYKRAHEGTEGIHDVIETAFLLGMARRYNK